MEKTGEHRSSQSETSINMSPGGGLVLAPHHMKRRQRGRMGKTPFYNNNDRTVMSSKLTTPALL